MAKVAIVEVASPDGKRAIAIEIVTDGEQLTIALDGSAVEQDAELLNQVQNLIRYVKDNYNGK